MNYLHEHTLLGLYGHLMIVTAFVTSIFASLSFMIATKHRLNLQLHRFWQQTGKSFYVAMALAAICAMAILYYLVLNRFYEFHYVWKYTNNDMNLGYMIASLWSGQEGSLLLWGFWTIVFSFVVWHKYGEWHSSVLAVVSLSLMFIFSMLLGVHIGDLRIGSSPFILIRELPENAAMPWTKMTDYLLKLDGFKDGTGLNPLLQNYWMIIHPPVLFSGFAAALFPFAFAIAGIWKKDNQSWLKPARNWGLVTLFTLGSGILMGGAWAYEALSFGGFWAWDPVENASLVPWLLMLGGAHAVVVSINRKKGYFMSMLFCILPFILVIYSSLLTRSGVLGESSVHSFTENGLLPHLSIFLFFFIVLAVGSLIGMGKKLILFLVLNFVLLIIGFFWSQIGILMIIWLIVNIVFLIRVYDQRFANNNDDIWNSREFQMILGVLILLISSFQITLSTSVPVINRLFGTSFDAFSDLVKRNEFYALWQTPFAILVILMAGFAHFFKYKLPTSFNELSKKIKIPLLASFIITVVGFLLVPGVRYWLFALLLFVSTFTVFTNFKWFLKTIKANAVKTGPAISHIGFALLIIGALVSGAGKTPISENRSSLDLQILDKSFENNENILIKKGDTLLMNNYFITFRGKFQEGANIYYDIGYYKPVLRDATNIKVPGDSLFTLYPFIQRNEKFGNVAEPDTRHYLTHDVFTYVKWADTQFDLPSGPDDDYMNEVSQVMKIGDIWRHDNMLISFDDIFLIKNEEEKKLMGLQDKDIAVKASFKVTDINDSSFSEWVQPLFMVKDSSHVFLKEAYSEKFETVFKIKRLDHQPKTLTLALQEREYLVMQALLFPGINILWTGCIVMLVGICISILGARKKKIIETDSRQEILNRV